MRKDMEWTGLNRTVMMGQAEQRSSSVCELLLEKWEESTLHTITRELSERNDTFSLSLLTSIYSILNKYQFYHFLISLYIYN